MEKIRGDSLKILFCVNFFGHFLTENSCLAI